MLLSLHLPSIPLLVPFIPLENFAYIFFKNILRISYISILYISFLPVPQTPLFSLSVKYIIFPIIITCVRACTHIYTCTHSIYSSPTIYWCLYVHVFWPNCLLLDDLTGDSSLKRTGPPLLSSLCLPVALHLVVGP